MFQLTHLFDEVVGEWFHKVTSDGDWYSVDTDFVLVDPYYPLVDSSEVDIVDFDRQEKKLDEDEKKRKGEGGEKEEKEKVKGKELEGSPRPPLSPSSSKTSKSPRNKESNAIGVISPKVISHRRQNSGVDSSPKSSHKGNPKNSDNPLVSPRNRSESEIDSIINQFILFETKPIVNKDEGFIYLKKREGKEKKEEGEGEKKEERDRWLRIPKPRTFEELTSISKQALGYDHESLRKIRGSVSVKKGEEEKEKKVESFVTLRFYLGYGEVFSFNYDLIHDGDVLEVEVNEEVHYEGEVGGGGEEGKRRTEDSATSETSVRAPRRFPPIYHHLFNA